MGELDNIGLGQATRLCQMKYDDRLTFLAEGLPIILKSSRLLGGIARLSRRTGDSGSLRVPPLRARLGGSGHSKPTPRATTMRK